MKTSSSDLNLRFAFRAKLDVSLPDVPWQHASLPLQKFNQLQGSPRSETTMLYASRVQSPCNLSGEDIKHEVIMPHSSELQHRFKHPGVDTPNSSGSRFFTAVPLLFRVSSVDFWPQRLHRREKIASSRYSRYAVGPWRPRNTD